VATATAGGTAASCTGSVSFLLSSGALIGTATTYTLASNQLKSVSLAFSSVSASAARVEIRPVVTQMGTIPSEAPCQLLVSIETYDTTTGVTHVYLNTTSGASSLPVVAGRAQ
jgi:hypothetical protein